MPRLSKKLCDRVHPTRRRRITHDPRSRFRAAGSTRSTRNTLEPSRSRRRPHPPAGTSSDGRVSIAERSPDPSEPGAAATGQSDPRGASPRTQATYAFPTVDDQADELRVRPGKGVLPDGQVTARSTCCLGYNQSFMTPHPVAQEPYVFHLSHRTRARVVGCLTAGELDPGDAPRG